MSGQDKSRVEHVNLVVRSLDESLAFFQAALPGWSVRGRGESSWYGTERQWLHFGTERSYITLNGSAMGEGRDLRGVTPGLAHVGIEVGSVDEVRARLVEAGYEIATIGADHPYRKTIYFVEPSGTEVEFIEYRSDDPAERNLYGGETSAIRRVGSAGQES